MDIFDLPDFGFLKELLSDSGKASLTEKMLIVGVVWWVMGRKVASHFKALEAGMKSLEVGLKAGVESLTKAIGEVKITLNQVEESHSAQLLELQKRVQSLEETLEEECECEEPVAPV